MVCFCKNTEFINYSSPTNIKIEYILVLVGRGGWELLTIES